MKARSRRGVVLLQTLVLSVVLSMMAVMVMKWVLARYMLAARNYRSTESVAHAQYINSLFSSWNSNFASIPSAGSMTIDGKSFTFSRNVSSSMRFNVTMQQD
jgi:hypothetical protein